VGLQFLPLFIQYILLNVIIDFNAKKIYLRKHLYTDLQLVNETHCLNSLLGFGTASVFTHIPVQSYAYKRNGVAVRMCEYEIQYGCSHTLGMVYGDSRDSHT